MLLKTKVEFVSDHNEEGTYQKETLEFLFATTCFGDAEKATIQIVKERYYPTNEDEIYVVAISSYKIEPDMVKADWLEEGEVPKWVEVHVKMRELKDNGNVKFKTYKYLKQAASVTHAESLLLREFSDNGIPKSDFSIVKVISTNFREVIA